ncbi:hypothetical protein K466DRAFT_286781 [Polyporus arcularius HHB13444]|uniref:Uncharacterized protein n=1 Tax=Polyporus arcularius HHB13444 TaxID=1314778 RepID=A0A5C3PQS2_9APHY|nr:hypothetical protein K466DRAFT_286781 [Polyporus arcularius HHB13444]
MEMNESSLNRARGGVMSRSINNHMSFTTGGLQSRGKNPVHHHMDWLQEESLAGLCGYRSKARMADRSARMRHPFLGGVQSTAYRAFRSPRRDSRNSSRHLASPPHSGGMGPESSTFSRRTITGSLWLTGTLGGVRPCGARTTDRHLILPWTARDAGSLITSAAQRRFRSFDASAQHAVDVSPCQRFALPCVPKLDQAIVREPDGDLNGRHNNDRSWQALTDLSEYLYDDVR